MDDRSVAAIDWLLASDEPAVRLLTRRDLLGEETLDGSQVLAGRKVQLLLSGQRPDGGFGVHPYQKWTGAHWRLVSLVELGIPAGDPRASAAAQTVLDWLTGDGHKRGLRIIAGLARRCASQEGNALAVCSRLGLGEDPRVRSLAQSLIDWQWPDGGWNCDREANAHRSSFHESLAPMWGLHEFWRATGDGRAKGTADRAAELFLTHRLFKSLRTGETIHRSWIVLHYPPFWHYDILQALLVLSRMGHAADARTADAVEILKRRQLQDGRWRPGGYWWRAAGSAKGSIEVVDWGRSGPNEMITLNALRVLKAAVD